MIDHLANIVPEFPGAANRTRCFSHILNLVVKCIMKQFDAPKGQKKNFEAALEGFTDELEDDAGDEDDCDLMDADGFSDELGGTVMADEDGSDDGRSEMTEEEISVLDEDVKPVRLVLFKVGLSVCNFISNAYINFTASKGCARNQELDNTCSA